MFDNRYRNKTVLVTGATGFKGSWLCTWLLKLGANVVGLANGVPTQPSLFEVLNLNDKIDYRVCDVRQFDPLETIINKTQPDFIFHLAAQAIVSESYLKPLETIQTNVLGTANLLEGLRSYDNECITIIITSDKCYENVEWEWGYKETDRLGGKDIYSGSKGAAELVVHAFQESYFKNASSRHRITTARAGNVIGGGDWATDRIVVDCIKTWVANEAVKIRCPDATRPWQHVLEPLSGYLSLGQLLLERPHLHGESFNFGPKSERSRTVLELIKDLQAHWTEFGLSAEYVVTDTVPFHEAGLLKLNCDKSLFHLNWEATLTYENCVRFVSDWYYSFYNQDANMFDFTLAQIASYEKQATAEKLSWAD